MKKRGRREVSSLGKGWVGIEGMFQGYRAKVIAHKEPAKRPKAPELSSQDVKKTENGTPVHDPRIIVGASLPANCPAHSIKMLNDLPHPRAGSLPKGIAA
jgi:hypothetical protein